MRLISENDRSFAVTRRDRLDGSLAARLPLVGPLARVFSQIAERRAGPVPTGLLALLPVAILLDVFDALDEFALGPIGMGVSFVVESAFLLGLTGRAGYSFGLSAVDLVPGLDIVPMATLTLLREIGASWGRPERGPAGATGPIIDV